MSSRRIWVPLAIVGAVLVFLAGSLLVVYTAAPGERVPVFAGGRIAVLPVQGTIDDGVGILQQIREFRRDGSVKGFVVYFDSPGGAVAPSQSLYRELGRLREEGYPVIAAIGSVGASGAYYAALGADSILALPGSITGSIGVLMEFPNAQELMRKVGVRLDVVKSSVHKDIGSPFREMTDEERALMQSVVDDVYDQFVDAVARERHLSRDSVLKVADGRVLSGRSAREYGLIDAEGDLFDAIDMAGRMAGLGSAPRTVAPREQRRSIFDIAARAAGSVIGRELGVGSVGDALTESLLRGTPRLLYLFQR